MSDYEKGEKNEHLEDVAVHSEEQLSAPLDEKADRRLTLSRLTPKIRFLLYLLSFLDRSNIGNARVAGLVTDIGLKGLQYNICAAVFFITYSAAEIPSNMALKLLRPSIWIPSIMVAWGLVMTFMCFVKDFKGLLIARLFLGLTEAGLFPGVNFTFLCGTNALSLLVVLHFSFRLLPLPVHLAVFWPLESTTWRALVVYMVGLGLNPTRDVPQFALEGMLTVIVAIVAFFYLHDVSIGSMHLMSKLTIVLVPETARFLTPEEKLAVRARITRDANSLATHFDIKFVWQALGDWKSWMQVIIYTGILIPVYAFSLFLPTIITGLGYSGPQAQLLSVPPYVVACIVTIAPGAGYAATIIAACGVFPTVAVAIAWAGNNAGGELKRGVVLAMTIGFGNLGGISSLPPGHGVVIGVLCMSWVASLIAVVVYRRLNTQKDELCAREDIVDNEERRTEYRDLGDASPLFRYTI
ncbi:major facilitator superfamily transporter [Rhizoctonia solani]|uniref:Major facilitator superfamily transporter n=1 Tax=Rhizoctonia solani TaxID=456999 RepID=A0A8H8P2J2_9AGAM|nr:major facilitator superfamily transporter [Rhizoctonia solani]QRW23990.1 major facilitator superfamily transporter [Rhizoctonia solani]